MNYIIFSIVYIIINDFSTVIGQDYFNDINNELSPFIQHDVIPKKIKVSHSSPNPKVAVSKMIMSMYKHGQIVECQGMRNKLHKMGREVICKPRKTVVKLNPDPGYIYIPDAILIDRCDGRCGHDSQSCMAIETTSSKVLVQRMQIGSFESPCYELEVEKHTRCKCGCDLMEEDCNPRQKYNGENCACECINMNEQMECTTKEGMFWDRDSCKCMCTVEEELCSDGYVWIPSLCRCYKVTP